MAPTKTDVSKAINLLILTLSQTDKWLEATEGVLESVRAIETIRPHRDPAYDDLLEIVTISSRAIHRIREILLDDLNAVEMGGSEQ